MAPLRAVWPGSALFAYAILSDTLGYEILGYLLYTMFEVLSFSDVYPTFTTNPASQTALLGDEVILQCQIESLPSAEITWTLNGQNVTKDTITMIAEGESTLRLYPVMYPDAGSYKCEGRNPLLNIVIYSDIGEVVVEGNFMLTLCILGNSFSRLHFEICAG